MLKQAPGRSRYTVIAPAVLLSIAAGLVPPFMTQFIGDAIQAFTTYTFVNSAEASTPQQLASARDALLFSIRDVSIRFVALGVAGFVITTIMAALWVLNGERIVKALRMQVYTNLSARQLSWFDLGMGMTNNSQTQANGSDGEVGSGGLMGRFTKDTDDVRLGCSQALGLVCQYLTTFVACLALSFWRSWQLTLVIAATFPVVTVMIAITERIAHPLLLKDRDYTAQSTNRLERVFGTITTVKAFNAERLEDCSFKQLCSEALRVDKRLSLVFGVRNGISDFVTLAMFVQGFWFGAFLVSSGRCTVGQVNTAFWACLSAAQNVQMCVPMLVTVEKGKVAAASLIELSQHSGEDVEPSKQAGPESPAPDRPLDTNPVDSASSTIIFFETDKESDSKQPYSPSSLAMQSPSVPSYVPIRAHPLGRRAQRKKAPRQLRKIQPTSFSGEMALRNVTFYYPSRPYPSAPALSDVNLFLPARETTYIVGGSGSGKSTVASVLMGLYKIHSGTVEVDEQDLDWLDNVWLRGHVACVSQGASLLLDGTVHDNVASGVAGQLQPDGSFRKPSEVTRAEVEAACRGALLHEFIRDLPDGYDSLLSGEKGASLSGGQRQRLAIARAWVRNPTVLILDEATSALDPTSRLLVNEAVKHWRRNRTTIVITHDLSPIEPHDFVYVMQNGHVVEHGFRHDIESGDVGACTPVFAFLLAKLLANLGNPSPSSSVTTISLIVLLVAFVNGCAVFAKYTLLEWCGMGWVVHLRHLAFARITCQDKSWFDAAENGGSSLANSVVKDTQDMRPMVATILGQTLVVVFMLVLGLSWSFSSGWELTLVGLGLIPIFVVFTRLQAGRLSSIESHNRALRAEVSTLFHKYEEVAERAYKGGLRAAPFTGMGSATATGLTLIAEAVMFYVGAVLIVRGRYTYAQMMEVFAMIILTITFAAQVMIFLPGVARSVQAAIDFRRLLELLTVTSETKGSSRVPIRGDLVFDRVTFAYPSRPDVQCLREASFHVRPGDFVGIVGPSGSGKSTIVNLLQRLYEPSGGHILLDGQSLDDIDVHHLRDHIAVVSQHPALFDMTVAANIAYGGGDIDMDRVEEAAKSAHVHDFIESLPQGYSTSLGESASLISGGQAQRLQIARALYQSRQILLLDECTSALDPTNQQAVMDTIMSVKRGKTALMVTHKLDVMERCDYLLVIEDGIVVESGSVANLRAKGGVFAQLASSGEWSG
ncbi:ATP-dependent permease [Microbotryomycetes sp. JL221]|nr:ATP-dependent permease [Microbotryomycetes sp. JL221]